MSHNHSHGPGAAAHAHDDHDVSKDIKKYLFVFGALLVGTVITVLASYVHFGSPAYNIAVALFIASVKAFLVAGYFMHLISEKKMVYGILASTVFFLIGLMFLTIWAMHDYPALSHVPNLTN
jgi:cytochrome c oxidase subunit 4